MLYFKPWCINYKVPSEYPADGVLSQCPGKEFVVILSFKAVVFFNRNSSHVWNVHANTLFTSFSCPKYKPVVRFTQIWHLTYARVFQKAVFPNPRKPSFVLEQVLGLRNQLSLHWALFWIGESIVDTELGKPARYGVQLHLVSYAIEWCSLEYEAAVSPCRNRVAHRLIHLGRKGKGRGTPKKENTHTHT